MYTHTEHKTQRVNVMKKSYHKKIEIWRGDDITTISDFFEKEGEPVFGVIITNHNCDTNPDFRTSLEDGNFLYIEQEDLKNFIKALQEFVEE